MKRIATSVVILLGLGLGACDDGEGLELEQVELSRTEDGIVLVGEDGQEFVIAEDELDMDVDVEPPTPQEGAIDQLATAPEITEAWCCDHCTCTRFGCACSGCKEVPGEDAQQ